MIDEKCDSICIPFTWGIKKFSPKINYSTIPRLKAGVILVKDGRVLVVQNYNFKWSFPKGGINSQESEISAAVRELEEETGIKIKESELDKRHIRYKNQIYYIHNFEGAFNIQLILDKIEITGIGWSCLECAQNLNLSADIKKLLRMVNLKGLE